MGRTSVEVRRQYDRERDGQPWRRWYKTARWQAIREQHLAGEPLCRKCKAAGRIVVAKVCDHIKPHRGDVDLFWNGPFQSLCDPCHSSVKQAEERAGGAGQKSRTR